MQAAPLAAETTAFSRRTATGLGKRAVDGSFLSGCFKELDPGFRRDDG
jgi:hypothetical protein